MSPKQTFQLIQQKIEALQAAKQKPVRIAINGIEGTGKTVFANKLTKYLQQQQFNAIQVTIDGYHNIKAIRYQQGRDSAKGYFEDAFNEQAFVDKVLLASQAAQANYTPAIHDIENEQTVEMQPIAIDDNTILITDGAYLFKPIYRPHWDLKIYLKVSFELAQKRGVARDKAMLGGEAATIAKYKQRYHKASSIYLSQNDVEAIADLVIDNSVFDDLKLI